MSVKLNSSSKVLGYETNLFSFEKDFDPDAFHVWTLKNWDLSISCSIIYVIIIFSTQYLMRDRRRFELRWQLACWSGILAVFSLAGAARTLPELLNVLQREGWYSSMCNPSYFRSDPTSFWAFMFVVSKVYELGDTLFIVLTKKPLIFLHWYHHISVMVYVWYSYTDHTAPGRWFMVMNYIVHTFMYTYYMLRAMRIQVPRWVNICITSLQILQMLMGLVVNCSVYLAKKSDLACNQTDFNLTLCSLMYVSYFFLFSHFFYHSYLKPKEAQCKAKKEE